MSTAAPDLPRAEGRPSAAHAGGVAGSGESVGRLLVYLVLGTLFGLVLTKSEAVSWFRIQEMFRFQSFHMYGIMGAAFVVGSLSLFLLRRSGARAVGGQPIVVPPKAWTRGLRRYWMGGTVFGLGWSLLGACPGPMFALLGGGVSVIVVPIGAALGGTWVYAWMKPRLPH